MDREPAELGEPPGEGASTIDPRREHRLRVARWFLAISYGVGAPVAAFLELRWETISERFALTSGLVLFTCAVQLVCAAGVLTRRAAPWAAVVLSLTCIGAAAAHVRIGSPQTALTALFFLFVQIWFALASWARERDLETDAREASQP